MTQNGSLAQSEELDAITSVCYVLTSILRRSTPVPGYGRSKHNSIKLNGRTALITRRIHNVPTPGVQSDVLSNKER